MTLSMEVWQVVTTVAVAILAGLFSFVVTILTKEQKTSEFRQAWVDALRCDLSEFASILISLSDIFEIKSELGHTRLEVGNHLLDDKHAEVRQLEGLRIRILLRLNPKEHKALIALIQEAYNFIGTRRKQEDGHKLIAEFIEKSQDVLKSEWRRVKRGELSFWITKWVSFAVFALTVLVAVIQWFGHLHISLLP